MRKFVGKFSNLTALALIVTGLTFGMAACTEVPCEDAYNSAKTCSKEAGIELDETQYLAACEDELADATVTKTNLRCIANAAGDCEMIDECND